MLLLTDTVKCERRCDIRRISGCMNPKIRGKISKGAVCQIYEFVFYFIIHSNQNMTCSLSWIHGLCILTADLLFEKVVLVL